MLAAVMYFLVYDYQKYKETSRGIADSRLISIAKRFDPYFEADNYNIILLLFRRLYYYGPVEHPILLGLFVAMYLEET
jgi:hypothetical protein